MPVVQAQEDSRPSDSAPVLSLTVDGGGETRLVQGWPLVVDLTVVHPRAFERGIIEPLVLQVENGLWADLITLEIRDGKGKLREWPLAISPLAELEQSLLLDGESAGFLAWLLAPGASVELGEGTYQVTAVLDDGGVITRSAPTLVKVVREAEPPTDQDRNAKDEHVATYHLLEGTFEQGLLVVDGLLKRQPDSVPGLVLRADLLAAGGMLEEALGAYSQAIDAALKHDPEAQDPPRHLLRAYNALLAKILEDE